MQRSKGSCLPVMQPARPQSSSCISLLDSPRCWLHLQGVSWLMCVPGASATVLEVVVPYSRGSLVLLLGQV